jgi:hypothetical protein
MRKTFLCGVNLHSNNAMYVITDQEDKPLLKKRLPNQSPTVLQSLEPFRKQLKVVAAERVLPSRRWALISRSDTL